MDALQQSFASLLLTVQSQRYFYNECAVYLGAKYLYLGSTQ